jgi:3-oxocholest-4-en-26-oate---CoA ligase
VTRRPATVRSSFNLADLFSLLAAEIPDRDAVVIGDQRWTFGEIEANANRVANLLTTLDVAPGSRVGVLSSSRVEWIEVLLGAFRARAVPIGVDVLASVDQVAGMLDHADAVVLVHEGRFGPLVAKIVEHVPSLRHTIVLDDGLPPAHHGSSDVDYGVVLATSSVEPPELDRSDDDLYMIYSGVLRDRPKGVLWRHEDLFFAALCGGGIGGRPITRPEHIVHQIGGDAERLKSVVAAPLTHANGQWATLVALLGGGAAVFPAATGFDPHEVWRLVERERCNSISLLGDGMARPLADAFSAQPDSYDASALVVISSGGALLSPEVRVRLQALLPRTVVLDSLGGYLHGMSGLGTAGARRRFAPSPGVAVLDDGLRPVAPGADEVGRVARSGHIPLGYHKDEVTTAERFATDEHGVRWAFSREWATVEADGTIALVGG